MGRLYLLERAILATFDEMEKLKSKLLDFLAERVISLHGTIHFSKYGNIIFLRVCSRDAYTHYSHIAPKKTVCVDHLSVTVARFLAGGIFSLSIRVKLIF